MRALSMVLVLILAANTGGVAATNSAVSETRALVGRTRPALALLVSVDRRGTVQSYGTGFFITADGVLVTARHVAQAEEGLVAVAGDGTKHAVTTFLGEDPDFDLSLLKIDGYSTAHLELAGRAFPETNQWAALVSAQDQVAPSCSTGLVTQVMSFPGLLAVIQTSVPVRAGQSGSPLLNADGQVIGVVPYMSFEDTVTASPNSALQALIDRARTNSPTPFARRPRIGSRIPLVFDPDFRSGAEALRLHDWKEAEVFFKRAARKFPKSSLVFAMLASVQLQGGDFKRAKTTVEKAFVLNPNNALPHLLKAVCLVQENQVPEAAAEARKSIELGLPDKDTLTSAWVLVATAESALGHPDKAREALESLRRVDSNRAASLRQELRSVLGE